MPSRAAALACALAVALVSAAAAADPLAVLAPDATGGGHPTSDERVQLADAVATTLGRSLPDVLAGGETRSRIEVLDPAQLACASPACAGQVATLLRARGVVLVRPVLNAARLDLTLTAVNVSGEILAEQHDATTIGDWQDALALGRLLAGRLATAMRPATTHPDTGATSGSPGPSAAPTPHDSPHANYLEMVAGGVLVAGGLVAVIVPAVRVAQGDACTANCPPSNDASIPSVHDVPNGLNAVFIVGGALAVIGGTVLLVHGGLSRSEAHARDVRPRVLGWSPAATRDGAGLSLRGEF